MTTLKIKRLHPDAIMPKYASDGAACFDLHAVVEAPFCLIDDAMAFSTGLAFEVPPGWVMLVYSRSGHAFKNNVRLANSVAVIDSDFRGEVRIKLSADHGGGLAVRNGDRIAQAMLVQAPTVSLVESDKLSETVRGIGGFGSTGIR